MGNLLEQAKNYSEESLKEPLVWRETTVEELLGLGLRDDPLDLATVPLTVIKAGAGEFARYLGIFDTRLDADRLNQLLVTVAKNPDLRDSHRLGQVADIDIMSKSHRENPDDPLYKDHASKWQEHWERFQRDHAQVFGNVLLYDRMRFEKAVSRYAKNFTTIRNTFADFNLPKLLSSINLPIDKLLGKTRFHWLFIDL